MSRNTFGVDLGPYDAEAFNPFGDRSQLPGYRGLGDYKLTGIDYQFSPFVPVNQQSVAESYYVPGSDEDLLRKAYLQSIPGEPDRFYDPAIDTTETIKGQWTGELINGEAVRRSPYAYAAPTIGGDYINTGDDTGGVTVSQDALDDYQDVVGDFVDTKQDLHGLGVRVDENLRNVNVPGLVAKAFLPTGLSSFVPGIDSGRSEGVFTGYEPDVADLFVENPDGTIETISDVGINNPDGTRSHIETGLITRPEGSGFVDRAVKGFTGINPAEVSRKIEEFISGSPTGAQIAAKAEELGIPVDAITNYAGPESLEQRLEEGIFVTPVESVSVNSGPVQTHPDGGFAWGGQRWNTMDEAIAAKTKWDRQKANPQFYGEPEEVIGTYTGNQVNWKNSPIEGIETALVDGKPQYRVNGEVYDTYNQAFAANQATDDVTYNRESNKYLVDGHEFSSARDANNFKKSLVDTDAVISVGDGKFAVNGRLVDSPKDAFEQAANDKRNSAFAAAIPEASYDRQSQEFTYKNHKTGSLDEVKEFYTDDVNTEKAVELGVQYDQKSNTFTANDGNGFQFAEQAVAENQRDKRAVDQAAQNSSISYDRSSNEFTYNGVQFNSYDEANEHHTDDVNGQAAAKISGVTYNQRSNTFTNRYGQTFSSAAQAQQAQSAEKRRLDRMVQHHYNPATQVSPSEYRANVSQARQTYGDNVVTSGNGSAVTDRNGNPVTFSDPDIKENITKVGELNNGLPIYSYTVEGQPRVGVMTDEAKEFNPEAVVENAGGTEYDGVVYAKLV